MAHLHQNDATRAAIEERLLDLARRAIISDASPWSAIEAGYRFSCGMVESRLLLEAAVKASDRLEAWLEDWPPSTYPPRWA